MKTYINVPIEIIATIDDKKIAQQLSFRIAIMKALLSLAAWIGKTHITVEVNMETKK